MKKKVFLSAVSFYILIALTCLFSCRKEKARPAQLWQPEEGLSRLEMNHDGFKREFLVHVPKNYQQGKAYPVVMAFHGSLRSCYDWPGLLGPLVKRGCFIGVYLQAGPGGWYGVTAYGKRINDIGFTEQVLAWLGSKVAVDKGRVYAVGYSLGGLFCSRLAQYSEKFAAIAALSGSFYANPTFNNSIPRVSVMLVHGKQDRVIPYEGGMNDAGYSYESARNSAALWARHNGCSSEPEIIKKEGGITEYHYNSCSSGREVLLIALDRVGHDVPWSCEGLFDVIWRFFERNPK